MNLYFGIDVGKFTHELLSGGRPGQFGQVLKLRQGCLGSGPGGTFGQRTYLGRALRGSDLPWKPLDTTGSPLYEQLL